MIRLACLNVALISTNVCACNIPVFRYALCRWHPDTYEVIVLHRSAISDAQSKLMETLEAAASDLSAPANIEVRRVDLGGQVDEPTQTLLEAVGPPEDLPWLWVRFPPLTNTDQLAYSGPLSEQTVHGLMDSPARREMVRRLSSGNSAVWVLIESGNKMTDDAAAQMLRKQLEHLESAIELPGKEQDSMDALFPTDPEQFASQTELPLSFSLLRISRDDPAERQFVTMLINSEPDLNKFDEPVVIPVFGRGRTYFALVGRGINPDNIRESCTFLAGACSCEVKSQNPGTDMLIRANWDMLLDGVELTEWALPELTGLGAIESDDSQVGARGDATAKELPNKTANPDPITATVPDQSTWNMPIYFPVIGIVLSGLIVVAIGTIVIKYRQPSGS